MKTLKRKKLVALSFIIIMLAVFIMQVSAAWDEVWLGDIGSGDLYCSGPWYYSTTSSTFAWDPGDEDYDFIGAFIDFYEYNPVFNASYGDILFGPQYAYYSVSENGWNPDVVEGTHCLQRGDIYECEFTYIYYN
jgi:hypothetical protein